MTKTRKRYIKRKRKRSIKTRVNGGKFEPKLSTIPEESPNPPPFIIRKPTPSKGPPKPPPFIGQNSTNPPNPLSFRRRKHPKLTLSKGPPKPPPFESDEDSEKKGGRIKNKRTRRVKKKKRKKL